MTIKSQPVIVEKVINAPSHKIWDALTKKEQMKKWYFDVPAFEPKVGNEFEFTGGPDCRSYVHLCKVTEVIEGRVIAYSWRYKGYEGNSIVRFELFPLGEKTKVTVTHEGLETFPSTNPDFAKKNFEGGWSGFINIELPKFIERPQN